MGHFAQVQNFRGYLQNIMLTNKRSWRMV